MKKKKKLKHEKPFVKMYTFFQIKPKLGTNVLQILHGQSTGFHFLISLLKLSRDSLFLISAGICSRSVINTMNWIS